MSDKQIQVLISNHPGILGVPSAHLHVFARTICEHTDLQAEELGSIIRRCPWIVTLDLEREIEATLVYLGELGVSDLAKIVRSFPQVLALFPGETDQTCVHTPA